MKTFIQGSSYNEDKEVEIAGDNIVPKYKIIIIIDFSILMVRNLLYLE
jgi:hypothetical protein